jgi:hypothetical protein
MKAKEEIKCKVLNLALLSNPFLKDHEQYRYFGN